LTLDQYLAQKKEKSSLIPQLETRKVEQDEGLWKGAKELVKGADEDVYVVGKVSVTCVLALACTHHDLEQGRPKDPCKEGGEGLLGDRSPLRTPQHQRSRSWW